MRRFILRSDRATSSTSLHPCTNKTTIPQRASDKSLKVTPSAHSVSWRCTLSKTDRIAITGMSINTPLGDTLDGYLEGLLAGRSALSKWKSIDTSNIYSKVGADLGEYDVAAKAASFEARIPAEMFKRMRKLVRSIAWSTRLTILMTLDAFL